MHGTSHLSVVYLIYEYTKNYICYYFIFQYTLKIVHTTDCNETRNLSDLIFPKSILTCTKLLQVMVMVVMNLWVPQQLFDGSINISQKKKPCMTVRLQHNARSPHTLNGSSTMTRSSTTFHSSSVNVMASLSTVSILSSTDAMTPFRTNSCSSIVYVEVQTRG